MIFQGTNSMKYEVACDMLNLSTLTERHLSICSTLFRQITRESHVLHYLLSAKRDAEVAGHLQSTKKCPTVRARTFRYKNSFIPYALFNFQWHFHACLFVYFHCMNVCVVLIQPLGCQNPINVMLCYVMYSRYVVVNVQTMYICVQLLCRSVQHSDVLQTMQLIVSGADVSSRHFHLIEE